jgi:hypothetical protein
MAEYITINRPHFFFCIHQFISQCYLQPSIFLCLSWILFCLVSMTDQEDRCSVGVDFCCDLNSVVAMGKIQSVVTLRRNV